MAFVGAMLNSGKGAGFEAQGQAGQLLLPTSTDQAKEQYGNAQGALAQQQAFAQAVSGQNGLGNQSNVFAQQQALANQLQNNANGVGPNPAQAALAQNTSNNVAQQSALMAGQRGSSANAGMLARQIGQQGANIQQQSVGQAATMQAQQQLAAQQALAQQQQAMQGVAAQQVGQQAGAISGYNQAAQNEQQNVLNSIAQQNNANVGMQSNINNSNASIAGVNAQNQGKLLGGALGGIGSAMGMAHGGMVHNYASGGTVAGPTSFFGQAMSGFNQNNQSGPNSVGSQAGGPTAAAQDPLQQGAFDFGKGLGKGLGKLFSSPVADAGGGGGAGASAMSSMGPAMMAAFSDGGKVGGQARVAGDSLKNDDVPAVLSPGEIVLPRSVTMHQNAPAEAAKFVAAILARGGSR